jgi:hypothetical protein
LCGIVGRNATAASAIELLPAEALDVRMPAMWIGHVAVVIGEPIGRLKAVYGTLESSEGSGA